MLVVGYERIPGFSITHTVGKLACMLVLEGTQYANSTHSHPNTAGAPR